jgi:transcription-repair coupling factor (superfamily II helicase)
MELASFLKLFGKLATIDQTASALSQENVRVHWKGLVGSSKSVSAVSVAQQVPGHHIFILNDKEEAAYFLNDLEGLFPEDKRILFYPASYRVPYQLEETDNANVVTRAEVLERIANGSNAWVVTYPEALFEKVPTKKKLVENTLKVEVGKSYSIDFINELLLEYHFERVDFVYEPGQFSIRGGIVDVYSYANDLPFRIEFFGDEVETIRTFDAATQLSVKTHSFFNVIPNIQGQLTLEGVGSFFEFIGKNANIWMTSYERTEKIIEKEYNKAVEI